MTKPFRCFIYAPFTYYYTGNPINPRFVSSGLLTHSDKTFSQEVRLVSHPAEGDRVDYVVGGFFQNRRRDASLNSTASGTDTYSQAQGCTAPFYLGASFPDCLVTLGPNSTYFSTTVQQKFKNESAYGELTLHATPRAQITLGARYYHEDFSAGQSQIAYTLGTAIAGDLTETKSSGALFKINPSFEFAKNQTVYATFSQGFRPGGANSFPITGPLAESPALLSYREDKTNNYEVGVKGRSAGDFSYSLALFDVEWDHPQIGAYTPNTSTAVVYNAEKARSTGFDAESSGPLMIPGLRFSASASYAHSRLTKDFSLPGNDGTGNISPGVITGSAGSRLPGSPEWSAAVTLDYRRALTENWSTTLTANATYTGSVLNSLPAADSTETPLGGYTLGNLSGIAGQITLSGHSLRQQRHRQAGDAQLPQSRARGCGRRPGQLLPHQSSSRNRAALHSHGVGKVKIRFKNGLVFDGHRPTLIADHIVGVADGRIVHFSKDPWDVRADHDIDLRGRVLLPGLIDAHYHAYAGINNHVQLEELPPAYLAHHARISLEGSLRRGFTSVRDAAGGDYALWRAIEERLFEAPRLFFGDKALSQTGGHSDVRPAHAGGLTCGCCLDSGILGQVVDGVEGRAQGLA